MTQLRRNRGAISNWFDERVFNGVGKRGSTFTDLDAVSHDKDTGRFLFCEFKQPGEALHPAQRAVLRDLAHLPGCTVWFLRRLENGLVGFGHFRSGRREEEITIEECRRRLGCWWEMKDYRQADEPIGQMITAFEIKW